MRCSRKAARLIPWLLGLMLLGPAALFAAFMLLVRTLREAPPQPVAQPLRSGGVDVSPASVTAGGSPVPVTVTYTVGPGGIARGGGVRLRPGKVMRFGDEGWRLCMQWANGWGHLQRRHPGRPDFLDVTTSRGGVELRVSLMERASDRTQLMWFKRKLLQKLGVKLDPIDPRDGFLENEKVTVAVDGEALSEGDTIEFTLGRGGGLTPPHSSMQTDIALEIDREGNGEFLLEEAVPSLSATGGEPARFEVVAPTIAVPGGRVKVLVRCLDERGLLAPGFSGRLLVSADRALEVPPTVVMPEGNDGTAWFMARVSGPGTARLAVRDGGGLLEGLSNPVACMKSPFLLLWGDMHTHSLVSDGTQEPWFLYHRARDLMGWDFTAVSDHDTWSLGEERDRSPLEFGFMMREADRHYSPGGFVTLRSFEWTHHVLGHRTVLFGPAAEPVFLPHDDDRYSTPELLFDALQGRDVLVVPHHPAWKTHAGEMRFDFGSPDNGFQRLAEVYSRHGNSEFYGCPRPMSHVGKMEGTRGRVVRAVLGRARGATCATRWRRATGWASSPEATSTSWAWTRAALPGTDTGAA